MLKIYLCPWHCLGHVADQSCKECCLFNSINQTSNICLWSLAFQRVELRTHLLQLSRLCRQSKVFPMHQFKTSFTSYTNKINYFNTIPVLLLEGGLVDKRIKLLVPPSIAPPLQPLGPPKINTMPKLNCKSISINHHFNFNLLRN